MMSSRISKALPYLVCLLLGAGILACYWQVRNHEFVNYDDDKYITENRHVQAGLTREGAQWAFTTTHTGNWHPVTWLSHMVDVSLFGLNPGRHHLVNVMYHLASSLLLFLALTRMTGAMWRSGFVAALFALHPLHVESVAWVAERKDVLSTMFWMLTMLSYVWYVKRPGMKRYLLVMGCFSLGLMAKPMLVTLPFVLLLLDYWPLGRLQWGQEDTENRLSGDKQSIGDLLWEKAPLFACTVVSSIITFLVQKAGGAVSSLEAFPFSVRIGNALVSYVKYIGKMVWPCDLAVFYPHPGIVSLLEAIGAGILLICLSVIVVRRRRSHPYLAVGWFWYLGTLIPVIGLIQVGLQGLADRYTYVPFIGLFVAIGWGLPELLAKWRYQKVALSILAGLVILGSVIGTWMQVGYWKNSISLFTQAVRNTTENWIAHNNLGNALLDDGNVDEAIHHYGEALRIRPAFAKAHNNLGNALLRQGNIQEATDHYAEALQINPDYAKARYNLATALLNQGKAKEAVAHYAEALRIEQDYVDAHYNLGIALGRLGKVDEAIEHLSEAVRIQADFAEGHYKLGIILVNRRNFQGAIRHLSEAVRLRPDSVEAHNNLGSVLAREGRLEDAIGHFTEAVRLRPDFAQGHYNLGGALAAGGDISGAVRHLNETLRIRPDHEKARQKLETLLLKMKSITEPPKSSVGSRQ